METLYPPMIIRTLATVMLAPAFLQSEKMNKLLCKLEDIQGRTEPSHLFHSASVLSVYEELVILLVCIPMASVLLALHLLTNGTAFPVTACALCAPQLLDRVAPVLASPGEDSQI